MADPVAGHQGSPASADRPVAHERLQPRPAGTENLVAVSPSADTAHDPPAAPESAAYEVAPNRLRRGQRRRKVGQILAWAVIVLGAALMPVAWQHGGPLGPGGRSAPGNPGYGPLFLGLCLGVPFAYGCWATERELASWTALLVRPDRLPAITCVVAARESATSTGGRWTLVPLDDPGRPVAFSHTWPAHGGGLVAHNQVEVFTGDAAGDASIVVDLTRNLTVVGNAARSRPVKVFMPDGTVRASRSAESSEAGNA